MNGCTTCGGWAGRQDPIAHDAEPDTPPAVCCTHKRFVPCRDDAEDCDISDHPADVEAIRRYQHAAEPQEDTVTEPTDELREVLVEVLVTAAWNQWAGDRDLDAVDLLLPVVTAWAEQHARERAAEGLDVATRWLMRTTDEHENGDWVTWDWRAKAADLLRALAADDRPDPGRC